MIGRVVRLLSIVLVVALGACRARTPAATEGPAAPPSASPTPWSEAWLEAEAERYLSDPTARRTTLVASLTNPENAYSRQRLTSYGLGSRGWDALPVWNPRSAPVTLATDRHALPDGTHPLWDGRRPETLAQWVALGREVFHGYPLRAEVFVEHALDHPELLARVGVVAASDGTLPGVRLFQDPDGAVRVGITCALCHASVDHGTLVDGHAHRTFDYGALRLAYHHDTGAPVESALATRMATWGPGRADVTDDEAEDPVAIPDLWGLRVQSALTQAGTLRHLGPAVLAIRQETQLLHSNHQRVRPPRELAWALAMYLYSLRPPPDGPVVTTVETRRGEALFERQCARCHANEAYGGAPVAAAVVGTDPALANGSARGTGSYRPPSLIRVRDAAPYLHQGAVATLDDLFDPSRLTDGFTRGVQGPGAVRGHPWGCDGSPEDRAALVAFLRTL